MKILIIYDSVYGNTEQIAQAIAAALNTSGEVKILSATELNNPVLKTIDLLIIGAPTQGGRPTPPIQDFLDKVYRQDIKQAGIAAFDTRLTAKWVKIFGYAAEKIADNLKHKGGNLIAGPEGFFVKGGKGPLKEGEMERAATWAKGLVK
jgi:flavodoxin I